MAELNSQKSQIQKVPRGTLEVVKSVTLLGVTITNNLK